MKNITTEVKWAIIFAAAGLLWMVLEKSLGWHDTLIEKHPMLTMLFMIPAIAIYVFALRDKKKSLGGTMTWKQGFISGLTIGVIVALLSPLTTWLTHEFITPNYFENAIAYSVDSGKATEAEALAFFNLKSYMMQGAIWGVAAGAVTAAIVSLFVRSK